MTHTKGKIENAGKKTKHIMTVGNTTHVRTSTSQYKYGVVVEFFETSFVICSKNPITENRVKSEPFEGLTSLIGVPWNQKNKIKRENKQKVNQWIDDGDLCIHFFTFDH